MAGADAPEVRVVRLETNREFCGAANAGIAAARGAFIQLLNNDTEVTAGWVEAGLAPFADATVGSVAPLVLVRSDPSRVDSAGDSLRLVRLADEAGPWPARRRLVGSPGDDVFGASGSSAFYRALALRRPGRSTCSSSATTRTSTWRSACGGPDIDASTTPPA